MNGSRFLSHNTPNALNQAVRLTTRLLPSHSVCFETIASETALQAAQWLDLQNHPQDEQLAALLWLLPSASARELAPVYLRPTLDALPGLWKQCLQWLDRRCDEPPAVEAFSLAPQPARSIVAAYLYILNEQGRRQIYESPDRMAEPLPIKRFLKNFLALARALASGASDTTADILVHSVSLSIHEAGLAFDLLPESTWVWEVSNTDEALADRPDGHLNLLKSFLRKFWLTTGSYPQKHALADKIFYVRVEDDRAGSHGAVDRLMASLAVRFPSLFIFRKERFSQTHASVCWSRIGINSWHGGLVYAGRRQYLLKSQSADPLAEFFRFTANGTPADQLRLLECMRNANF